MSAFILKIIALLIMFVDHTGAVCTQLFDVTQMREIGRMAFPIFIFFIAEGCRRTHNIRLYMLRLGLFALISEFPFDLATAGFIRNPSTYGIVSLDFLAHQNVFFTFFLGVLCVYIFQALKGYYKLFYIVLIPFVIWLGDFLHTDYGSAGVLFVFILYILPYGPREPGKPPTLSEKGKFLRIAAILCLLFYLYVIANINKSYAFLILRNDGIPGLVQVMPQLVTPLSVDYFLYGCASLLLLAFYNGKRGRPFKWFFYAAYPAHLLLLGIFRFTYVIPKLLK